MKFAKQLETEAENIPLEWRPYLIQYKALKKMITKVTQEIESRGLSASLLHECLYDNNIKYHFTGEPPHVKPNIEFIYDQKEPKVQEIMSRLITAENPKLKYKESHDNKDIFSFTKEKSSQSEMIDIVKELFHITSESDSDNKSIVIELEKDSEFFNLLIKELTNAIRLQDETAEKFKNDISALESKMIKLGSPSQKKTDMYSWRKIFSIYMDACIFQTSSVEKSKKQMQWFLNQLDQCNQLKRLKNKESKCAFEQFIALNTELITINHYQLLNQTAMRKILKKHDKHSGLSASDAFNQLVAVDQLSFNPKLTRIMYAAITEKLTSIIPQPDDYSCPVCMCVAWRPIRLSCNHVFCVRCLIKAQRQKMDSCPLCRHPSAVSEATAYDLDESLQNFLKLYFPKEIQDKKRDNEREQAIEDVQAMTGKRYTKEQLLRMNNNSGCCIM
ncbi:hypothetical protein G6F57_003061 [Rhizopus arrhizus]|uniref:SPX domain-containing protein n=1 Tax=Rhizopus oryzae TaxID=64495 RepID=A0A9P7BPI9_RHIOR|nr:hypothetical protein G6F24_006176 [Rhizopus arrhizus]KAG1417715.1 hypothetical protein G6F58_005378 [Rhizopus delemar]KAG0794312.1 hypothetical protein G6F21_002954 [Rhizopus arrhizus]KAG0808763.1 hypothetical protein G6F20_009309 [Rhizopus arrhizus]KAG0827566.1 hypothetical protein G6F18_009435 [Rhizopus arrhizus]